MQTRSEFLNNTNEPLFLEWKNKDQKIKDTYKGRWNWMKELFDNKDNFNQFLVYCK